MAPPLRGDLCFTNPALFLADGRDRTGDLRFTKALLYQLSYIGEKKCGATSCLPAEFVVFKFPNGIGGGKRGGSYIGMERDTRIVRSSDLTPGRMAGRIMFLACLSSAVALERDTRIELASLAWEASILPLY